MKELKISDKEAGLRLDKYLLRYLCNANTSFIYKMMRKKNITLNDKKCEGNEKLNKDDSIKIYFSDETLNKFTLDDNVSEKKINNKINLKVEYEDDDILIVNKPCGVLSQKAKDSDVSLIEYITDYLLENKKITKEDLKTFKVGVCNRLDMNTSGLVVAGKSVKGLQKMSMAFKERTIHKYYICIVKGKIIKRQLIKGYLLKDEKTNKVTVSDTPVDGAAYIETEYMPVVFNDKYTLLKVNLLTGKSHQIRAHLSYIKHPLLGDYKYGDSKENKYIKSTYGISSQLLHAFMLEYPEENLNVSTEIPKDFIKILKGEKLWEPGIQEVLEALH